MSTQPILPFALDFNLLTGMCDSGKANPTHRFVSNMISQFGRPRGGRRRSCATATRRSTTSTS